MSRWQQRRFRVVWRHTPLEKVDGSHHNLDSKRKQEDLDRKTASQFTGGVKIARWRRLLETSGEPKHLIFHTNICPNKNPNIVNIVMEEDILKVRTDGQSGKGSYLGMGLLSVQQ